MDSEPVSDLVRSIILLAIAMVFAFFMTYIITPLVRKLAFKTGAIDVPKDERRMHKKPIPTMGGLGIFITVIVGVLVFVTFDRSVYPKYVGMLIGALMIVAIGMLDDIYNVKPWIKFGVQVLAALVVVFSGMVIENGVVVEHGVIIETIFGFPLGNWAYPVTILWIVGVTNAINLIDGLDGLACGISAISAMALMVVSLLTSNFTTTIIAALLAGSCLGFLPYNLNPAKIFMGDVGAMFLGFALSVLSIEGSFKVSFAAPFLVLGFPLLDTFMAVVRRLSKKQSVFQADRKHFHHRLVDMGLNQKQSVMLLYAVSALLAVAAVLLTLKEMGAAVMIMIIAFVIGLVNWGVMKRDNSTDLKSEETGEMDETEKKDE